MSKSAAAWDAAAVRAWLESRVAVARADQVVAERRGREGQDDCDAAAAEEMTCALLLRGSSVVDQAAFTAELKLLLERDDHAWRGIYDERRFDRHVRAYARRLARMAKTNEGFGNVRRYQ